MAKNTLSKILEKQGFSGRRKSRAFSSETRKKQKFLAWLTIIITAINFLLILGFVIYLYFWVKAH